MSSGFLASLLAGLATGVGALPLLLLGGPGQPSPGTGCGRGRPEAEGADGPSLAASMAVGASGHAGS